ncbi:hypothetical protein JCM33374_g2304 [Metschnikowia sp. JCM 33374]|nr:hypothetical protein JCM33374_g2304 [Metschnikowia sp. JCM 33374]
MEYNNAYIDDGDMPPIEDDQSSSSGSSSQYMHHENGVSELGNGTGAQHHPIVDEEELLAAQEAADAAVAQQQQHGTPGGVFNNVGQGLAGKNREVMMQYWQETINSIEHDDHDFKNHQLPLARIKKVMKTDEDVRMISAEAPILFAKGCDVFITELTMRAWIHAEENKRRTLQKSDIAAALTKSDMFDFLIDVVPREEEKPKKSYPPRHENFGPHAGPSSSLHMLHGSSMQMPHMNRLPQSSMSHLGQPASASVPGNLSSSSNPSQPPAGPDSVHVQQELNDRPGSPTHNTTQPQASHSITSHQAQSPEISLNQRQAPHQQQVPSSMGVGIEQNHVQGVGSSHVINGNQNFSGAHPQEHAAGLKDGETKQVTPSLVVDSSKDANSQQKPTEPYYENYSSYENNF